MPTDPLPVWKTTYAALPLAEDPVAAADNISAWVDERLGPMKMGLEGVDPEVFAFGKAALKSALLTLAIVPTQIAGAIQLAGAMEAGALASTMTVTAGASVLPPPPPTTGIFGPAPPPVTLQDPPSVVAAKAALVDGIVNMPLALTPLDTEFPDLVREFFLAITYSITGVDTTPPTAGPLPLNLVSQAVE